MAPQLRIITIITVFVFVGCLRHSSDDGQQSVRTATIMPLATSTVDDYLGKWDQFAQGQNQLAPYLREHKPDFEQSLTVLLPTDRGAVARLVFYPVVQVGGSIPADTPLGVAALRVLGPDFNITTTKAGERVLFAADLYLWWEKHQTEYPHFSVFDDWQSRDFAQKTVLPMYRRVGKQTG